MKKILKLYILCPIRALDMGACSTVRALRLICTLYDQITLLDLLQDLGIACVFACQFFVLNPPDSHDYVQPVCLWSVWSNRYAAGNCKSLSCNKVRLVLGNAQAVLQPTCLVQDVTSVGFTVWIKIVDICGLYATSYSALSLYSLLLSFFIVLAENFIF